MASAPKAPAKQSRKLPTHVIRKKVSMTDTPPNHLSINPKSPFYDEAVLERGIGIRFNGTEKHNVEEYNIAEGWIRVPAGKTLDRKGNPLTIKLKGTVEAYFRAADATGESRR
jgi:hypothetical protein